MTVQLIGQNILTEDNFLSATEQEGEKIGQPIPGSNSGNFRLLSSGDIENLSLDLEASSDGAADGTTVIDSSLKIFGDDYFIEGTVTIDEFLQDTGDYTEQDVPGRITLTTANKVTITNADNNEVFWLNFDMGVDHFDGDCEFKVQIKCTDNNADYDKIGFWMISNTDGTLSDRWGSPGMSAYWAENSGSNYILIEDDTSSNSDQSVALSLNTDYYIHIKRDESVGTYGTLYLYIYDDEAMTSLVDTLSVELAAKEDYRYLNWVASWDAAGGGTGAWDGIIQNFYIVTTEEKDVTDFAQSTGTLTVDAFTYRVNNGTEFTLEVAFSTRAYEAILDGSGDAGNATFKWCHDGGTVYFGRDDPYQATWAQNDLITGAKGDLTCAGLTMASDGTWIMVYRRSSDNALVCSRTTGYILNSGTIVEIDATNNPMPVDVITLKSGRILVLAYLTNVFYIYYSDDHGASWSSRYDTGINTGGIGDDGGLAEFPGGNIIIVHDKSNEINCQISSDGGFTWSTSVTITAAANEQSNPKVVIANNGDVFCVYQTDEESNNDIEIKGKISSDGGATWGSAIDIMDFAVSDINTPDIVKDINGTLYCVAEDGNNIKIAYSDDHGATWTGTIDTGQDSAYAPRIDLLDGHYMVCLVPNAAGLIPIFRGYWETYSSNGCPCAMNILEQKLINNVGVIWQGGSGISGDNWDFTPEYDYSMKNLISDSPSKPWRSEQDNIDCNIVIDMEANVRFLASGVAFFGSNIASLSFQMNASDSWGSPSVDEAVSFQLATGASDADDGNTIKDTSLLASYKDHQLRNKFLRMTNGSLDGYTWKIADNVSDYFILDTTDDISAIADGNTFQIFQNKIAVTFTEGLYRYMRIAISAQNTADGYYQLGIMLLGSVLSLSRGWSVGYGKERRYDINMVRIKGGGIYPIKEGDESLLFNLTWNGADEDVQDELISITDYLQGENICLIPDSDDLTECYPVKLVSDIDMRHVFSTNFKLSLQFEEVK